jgi:hypothetical protein
MKTYIPFRAQVTEVGIPSKPRRYVGQFRDNDIVQPNGGPVQRSLTRDTSDGAGAI